MTSRAAAPDAAVVKPEVSFLAFFLIWAGLKGWVVPDIHVRACFWLEHRGELAVFRCFRGFGKSTLLDLYNAWCFYRDRDYRILLQSESDATAEKNSRDIRHVLQRHPLTQGLLPAHRGTVEQWWVEGAGDPRNASLYARGILSNVTSARADEAQNDDVEVPRNIQTPEGREKLRLRLGEQTHILVPGGRQLFIGTPHTYDSLYDEMQRQGADCLTIRLFAEEFRMENLRVKSLTLPFAPDYVFSGIGRQAELLTVGRDYLLENAHDGVRLRFREPPRGLVDFYGACAWPARFTPAELLKRRRRTRTLNEWDSQYQLHSKPVGEIRLDPARLQAYEVEPELRVCNRTPTLWLGGTQVVGMALRWDPASGKLKSDMSSVSVIFQDRLGRRYWHRAVALRGDVAEFDGDGKTITGGQVMQLAALVRQFQVPRITLETNGIGNFAPAVLKACLKQQGLHCGVATIVSSSHKNKRILEAFEPLIGSGMLWAHVSVLEAVWEQMQEWNPALTEQPDDHLDSAAGAIADTPERIRLVEISSLHPPQNWLPDGGVHEVGLDL